MRVAPSERAWWIPSSYQSYLSITKKQRRNEEWKPLLLFPLHRALYLSEIAEK
jgi:hypothetical protein